MFFLCQNRGPRYDKKVNIHKVIISDKLQKWKMLSFLEVSATYLHVNFVVDVVYVGRYDNPSYSFYATVQFFNYVRWSLSCTSRGRTPPTIATSASSYEINALPPDLRSPLNSRLQFRSKLKTHLFRQAYNTVWFLLEELFKSETL